MEEILLTCVFRFTDRCNLRCKYCMPDGVTDVGMKNILTFEEIWEIVRAGVSLGITHVRITGGEPLVRKGCVEISFEGLGQFRVWKRSQ